VCAPSTTSITQCSSEKAAICQSSNNSFVAVAAKWPASGSPSGFSPINGSLAYGLQLSFENGDNCYPLMTPRTATIQFLCSSETVGPITVVNNECNYIVTFPTSYACVKAANNNCTVVQAPWEVDLTSLLVPPGFTDYSVTDSSGYTYDFNVCGVSTTSVAECVQSNAIICQTKGSFFAAVIAAWPPSGPGSGIRLITDNIFQGVEIVFANGNACYPSMAPRTARIQFVCFNGRTGPITVLSTECDYAFVFPTSAACAFKNGELPQLEDLRPLLPWFD